jgi:hypothetical protein
VIARATGMLDGRPATVVLVEHTDGAREVVVILTDPCEVRDLP